jgi:hypothetical protein
LGVDGTMIETNLRIVGYGERLYLDVRRIQIRMSDTAPDLPEKVCRSLRLQHGLAAVPHRNSGVPELLVATTKALSELVYEGSDWRAELSDVGHKRLYVQQPRDADTMARLFERHLQIQLRRRTGMWTLDSPRIWYEEKPFQTRDSIAATRRYTVSVIPVEGKGLGVVVHVSTAFFTTDTIADFFEPGVRPEERERRQQRFERLSLRQRGQRGTLMYDLRQSHHKCYFVDFLPGVTCATTGPLPVNGKTYPSLYKYYEIVRPYAGISANDPVASVSFPGLDRPSKVAANRLYLRVMNKDVPGSLSRVDKITPEERVTLTNRFWRMASEGLLGKGIKPGLWRPSASNAISLNLPTLLFGQKEELPSPTEITAEGYRTHFRSRLSTLDRAGCYHVPPTIDRQIVIAYPSRLDHNIVDEFAEGLVKRLKRWTHRNLSAEKLSYTTVPEAIHELNSRDTGMVVFVFEESSPETYYMLSIELKNWRIKRVTVGELTYRFQNRSFVDMNALDVLEQLDCVPWMLATPLHYQAQLAIDVGVEDRYFALSLLVCRSGTYQTSFWLDSLICPKPDSRRETIERNVLRDQIIKLCSPLLRRRLDPIESLLVLRDGRKSGKEGEAIREAQAELTQSNILSSDARVDIVDFAKRSLKDIRLWEHRDTGTVNTLEGTVLLLEGNTAVLANTGAATLHLGTSNPLVLTATHDGVDMLSVADDVFATTQLNWSSPRVAQRLPMTIGRTDRTLEERRAQEVRGLR